MEFKEPIAQFSFVMGQALGLLNREEVKASLKKDGITDQDIEDFEKASMKICESFYKDRKYGPSISDR